MDTADKRIPDDEFVYRRVPFLLYPNPLDPNSRPMLNSFLPRIDDTDGLSVDLATLTTPEKVADIPGKKYHVVQVCVRDLRNLGLDVFPNPQRENPAHAIIIGLDRQTYNAEKTQIKALVETIIREHCETVWISPEPS